MQTGASRAASPASEIRNLLEAQTAAWNRGDIEGFMAGYWKSGDTTFVGANGMFRGWHALLGRYRRVYPDRKAMGQLAFSNLEVHMLAADAAYVTGEYHLTRETDRPEGVFTLIFRRFPEGWRIVHDHTTALEPAGQSNR